jgi:glutathione S-transferase
MEGQVTIGYWKLRGRGQVLRHLCAYTGLNWTEKNYENAGEWFAIGDKTKLGLDFPNLPYLISGDFKLTESLAIANYIIRKSGRPELLGKSVEDNARVEMVLFMLDEIHNPTINMFFSPNHETEKVRLFDSKIKAKIEELNKFIGEKDFTLGYLTLADFKIAEASYYFEKLYTGHEEHFKKLVGIRERVENLPEIRAWYEKGGLKGPFLPQYAKLQF